MRWQTRCLRCAPRYVTGAAGRKVYYIGTNSTAGLTELRCRSLAEFPELPVSGDYLHRACFDIARQYGTDTLLMIQMLGTGRLPTFFALKGWMDAAFNKPPGFGARRRRRRKRCCIGSRRGAAGPYQAAHAKDVDDIIAWDIALRRNDDDWFEVLPAEIEAQLHAKVHCRHVICQVFHQDDIVEKGADAKALKRQILDICDRRGAEYPAEHNVGHLYHAKPSLRDFYETLDPTNSFNPGIGKTSKQKRVRELA